MVSGLKVKGKRQIGNIFSPLLIFILVATILVVVIPAVTQVFVSGVQPNAVQSVAVSFSLILLTVGLLYYLAQAFNLSSSWLMFAVIYNSAIVIIKFIISPAYLHNSLGSATKEYLLTGLVVMVFYLIGFWLLYILFERNAQKAIQETDNAGLSLAIKLLCGVLLLLLAFVARMVAANFLSGTAASDYLKAIFSGAALTLPILLAIMIFSTIWAWDKVSQVSIKARHLRPLRIFFQTGSLLIITYHLLWLIYVINLFP